MPCRGRRQVHPSKENHKRVATGGRFKEKRRRPVGCKRARGTVAAAALLEGTCEGAEGLPRPSEAVATSGEGPEPLAESDVEDCNASRQSWCWTASLPCDEMGAMTPQNMHITLCGPPSSTT
eukprot:1695013-Amphidinium_carterae.1